MARSRAFKQQWIDETNTQIKDAGILLVAHYKGLSVAEITDLRINSP
jgi:ribosomal protein L10